jgi:hypothetical protein
MLDWLANKASDWLGLDANGWGRAVVNFGVKAIATKVVTSVIFDRKEDRSAPSQDAAIGASPATPNPGFRIFLQPATNNKLPVFYGTAWMKCIVTDAKISTDMKTMWYVLAITEAPTSIPGPAFGQINFGTMKWGEYTLNFNGADATQVDSMTNTNGETDPKVKGKMFVYKYRNGSSSGVNTTQTAIQVLSDASIAAGDRWTSTDTMSNTAFIVVKVIYDQEVGLTGIESITSQMTNTISDPGSVFYDYLTNIRYGCNVDPAQVNTVSLTDLSAYSAQLIDYTPQGGGPTSQRARYTINGILETSNDCFSNLQVIADACDSWVQWNEISGKWGVVINKAFDEAAGSQPALTVNDLFNINDDNLIGNIEFTPTDLNNTFNVVEAAYPDTFIDDQVNYSYEELDEIDKNPNEPENILTLNLYLVNNYIQARYISVRRLIQSREDLVITATVDYSGIQIDAGDVIRFNNDKYQWTNKLFRVVQVLEGKDDENLLTATLLLNEYNEQVYDNINITDYIPSANTGIGDPTLFGQPGAPIVDFVPENNLSSNNLKVTATVPSGGIVTNMDFYAGYSDDTSTHNLYTTSTSQTGAQFNAGDSISVNVTSLLPNSINITGITNAAIAEITTAQPHGLVTNDVVYIYNVNGMAEINAANGPVIVTAPNKFTFTGGDSSNLNVYTGGGVVQRPVWFSVSASNGTVQSTRSLATKFAWGGAGVAPAGVGTASIAFGAVTDTTYNTTDTDTGYNTTAFSTVYELTHTATAPLAVNQGDLLSVNGCISLTVDVYSSNPAASNLYLSVAICTRRVGETAWIPFFVVDESGGLLGTSSSPGYPSVSFNIPFSGLSFFTQFSVEYEFGYVMVLEGNGPLPFEPQLTTVLSSAISVSRLRR